MKTTRTLSAMLTAILATLLTLSAPASAEIQHFIEYGFGVGYVRDPNLAPQGRVAPLYQGRYTARITHVTDGGLRFRFDLGVALGNTESPGWDNPDWRQPVYPSPRP